MPAEPRILNDEEMAIDLNDAKKINEPVIYGLSSSGVIVYVGKTTRAKKRFYCYMNTGQCHNKHLAEFIDSNIIKVVILSRSPVDLDAEEIHYINSLKPEFNKALTQNNFVHKTKPWHSGIGCKTPSDILMGRAAKSANVKPTECFADIYELRRKMQDKDRCGFEVGVYMDMPDIVKKQLKPWFDGCRVDMLECMENG